MSAVATERRRRRAGGGRHAAPPGGWFGRWFRLRGLPPGTAIRLRGFGLRFGIVGRLLVSIATSLLGVALAAAPQEAPLIVASGPQRGPRALVVLGAALIVLGWAPVLDLLLRRRREIRRAAGPWPVRVTVAGVLLIPIAMIVEASRGGARWPWVIGSALLMLAQAWGLATLWRGPAGAPDG